MTWIPDSALEHLRRVADWPDLEGTRYEVVEEIGRGGMGVVYRVRDRDLERDAALKVLALPDAEIDAERIRREARILASLEHPGVVPVHDVGTLADGRTWYVMKLVVGRRLDEHATASLAERLRIFERICEAVAFAHARGIVHRDLKPANVMIGAFGEVLVLDWGVAGLIADGQAARGTVMGTPGFMAPEQACGDMVDARADVYSLGAILSFLLTGDGPDRPDIPSPLAAVCAKALAPAAADRYQSAVELAGDVAAFLDRLPVAAYRENLAERALRLAVKYRTPILLVLAYLAMRAALLFFRGV